MTERTQFADRGIDLRPRIDYNTVRYQEMPMVPTVGDSAPRRAAIANAIAISATAAKIDRRLGRPPRVPVKVTTAEQEARRCAKHRATKGIATKATIDKLFADGPLTTEQVAAAMGQKEVRYAGRTLRTRQARGLVVPAGTAGKFTLWRKA